MEDKYYMTYILLYSVGVLTLVPANFFTTATDYWMYKFRDPKIDDYTSDNRTGLQAQFIANYTIISHVGNLAFLIVTFLLLSRLDATKRLLVTQCGIFVIFILTVSFVQINTDTWQTGFFNFTLATGFLLTVCCSIFLGTFLQLAAKFPPNYLPVILNGQSICGILSALIQIFSLGIGASSKTSALIYFLVGNIFVLMTLIQFLITLKTSRFFKHYLEAKIQTEKLNVTKEAIISVLNKIKFYAISMIIVFGSTIMIHPGITSLVISVDKGNGNKWNDTYIFDKHYISDVYFVPVVTFLIYNICDYIGKECANYFQVPKNDLIIFVMSSCRVALVPLLIMCNAQPRDHLSVAFNDWVYIIFIIVFSFTYGFLGNLCIIQIPSVTEPEERSISIILMLLSMIISLGACSFVSAALIRAL